MKTRNLLVVCALFIVLNLISADRVGAQIFTTLKSFGIFTNVTGFNPQSTLVQGPDGTLYGTARNGEGVVAGTVFKVQADGSGFTVLKWFTNSVEGANPVAGLVLSDDVLYGTTSVGGMSNLGTVFKINTDGSGYKMLKSFAGSDGANPYYARINLSGAVLFGATYHGGSWNLGTVFKLNTDGTGYTVLKDFTGSDGAGPNAELTLSGSVLYGTTEDGGTSAYGTVFKMNTNGTGYAVLHNFTNYADGAYPDGVLSLSGGALYGTTDGGGVAGYGTVFRLSTDGTGYALLNSFDGTAGIYPGGALALAGSVLYGTTTAGFDGTVFQINTDGTGFTNLHTFHAASDGSGPYGGVTLSGGVLYGTTDHGGGGSSRGTVFKLNTDGSGYATVQQFNASTDGAAPAFGLASSNSVLYGATSSGGTSNLGTLFKVNKDGTGYTVLKNFAGSDGSAPARVPTLAGGMLYGTTLRGGSSNVGTVFAVNTDGTDFTTLYNFTGGADGARPAAPLVISGSTIYGTTSQGGNSSPGTVFRLNSDGSGFTNLYSFTPNVAGTNSDGATPWNGIILAGNTLYGTASRGGTWGNGTVFAMNTDGTGFTNLHSFSAGTGYVPTVTNTDGADPYGGLVLSGNTLYGAAATGGDAGNGTIFALNTDGSGFTTLHSFAAGIGSFGTLTNSDGAWLIPRLVISGNTLYGGAFYGGNSGGGTLFALHMDGTGFTNLYDFTGGSDGARPNGLLLSGDSLYGTASAGGLLGNGTVFSLSFPPQLSITASATNVILSWPVSYAGFDYTGYTLQSTTSLVPPVVWVTNSPAPVVINGQLTVTNPIAGTQQFYRLTQ
jgi:uncharacterized repeat protein (TIGR03803 family)